MWLAMRVLNQLSPPICLGAIAAILAHQPATFRWLHRLTAWRWSAPAALATVIAALAVDAVPDWVSFIAMTWLIVACVLRPERQPLAPMLMNPVVRHIGVVSYGVYLLHMLSINLVRGVTHAHNGTMLFAMVLPVSIAAATVSYRLFETPFLRLKDRFAEPATVTSAAIARVMSRRGRVASPLVDGAPTPVFGRTG
jgi:peptidoglycan/LPS O-acetylase OafA/YrhL